MKQKIVVRYLNKELVKGDTSDFFPNKETFHVTSVNKFGKEKTIEVELKSLKAIFFVKDLEGNKDYRENKLALSENKLGKHVAVTFKDGEMLRGSSLGVSLKLQGFFLFPSDKNSNNRRIYVVSSSVKEVKVEK